MLPTIIILYLPLALLIIAMICDLRTREIPDCISLLLIAVALLSASLGIGSASWLTVLIGGSLGFVLSAVLFQLGGLGGGDVKLITAIGAVIGPGPLLITLFWMALFGGLLAIVAALRKKNDYAYAPAIAFGFVAYLVTFYLY